MARLRWTLGAIGVAGALAIAAMGATHHASSLPRLAWQPPRLTDPTTVNVRPSHTWLHLVDKRDYVIKLPKQGLSTPGGLTLEGGHNVVLIGGLITIPTSTSPDWRTRRALYLKNQTGTAHVEGLRLGGPGITEGIDVGEQRGATVQIENVSIATVHAHDERNFTDNHPDLLQDWAGPKVLRVDGLSGRSDYQGIFLGPNDVGTQPPPRLIDLRRITITGTPTAKYLLWQKGHSPLSLHDVWVEPNAVTGGRFWPADGRWSAVHARQRPAGDYVTSNEVGLAYRSPGYQ